MSKELSPLEALYRLVFSAVEDDTRTVEECLEYQHIIETALKRLNAYENYGINLKPEDDVDKLIDLNGKLTYIDKVLDTQQRLIMSVSSEEINILSKVFNSQVKKVRKQLKALEIIKEKEVNVRLFIECKTRKEYNDEVRDLYYQRLCLTQEEYELLKEVLL